MLLLLTGIAEKAPCVCNGQIVMGSRSVKRALFLDSVIE